MRQRARRHGLGRGVRVSGSLAAALLLGAMGVGALALPEAALGQARPGQRREEPLRPPTPPADREAKANYWGALAVLVGIGALCAANLIPSKRGHQD